MTKKDLRDRWKSKEFIAELPFLTDNEIKVELLNGVDLRGITKIGCGEPFWNFPNLTGVELKNVDFSYGDGSISITNSQIDHFSFEGFKFDRSSKITKSSITNSTFLKSKLILNVSDTTFDNCDFSSSTFKGGFNEWGFRRCRFLNCNFTAAFWKNTYFFACKFIACDFKDFKIENALIRGFKVDKITQEVNLIFENCKEISGLIQIEQA